MVDFYCPKGKGWGEGGRGPDLDRGGPCAESTRVLLPIMWREAALPSSPGNMFPDALHDFD